MSVVPYRDVEFLKQLGGERRQKRQTMLLEDEQEPACGRKKVNTGHEKVEARQDFNRMLYKTSNKDYNDIQEMLNDNNVSNKDACKK